VVIAGGGPTGLMLAAELKLAGVEAVVVERRASQELEGTRAGGLHARTIEVLDQRGVADRFLSAGQTHPRIGFAQMSLDIGDFPTRHNYLLALWQNEFERILAGWVAELGVRILHASEVTGFAQDDSGVDVELADGTSLRAGYLVGCDGGRSAVRRAAGIDFPGLAASSSFLIAQVHMTEQPPIGLRRGGGGIGPVDRERGGNPYGVVIREREVEHAGDPTLDDLREVLMAADGTDYGVHSPIWLSRFTDAARQAAAYRAGRVLLAGDAAHIHFPSGGQGLNLGVQDAVNLGWKLGLVVRGRAPESLLDTYGAERHPVGARVVENTSAQVALGEPDDRHAALRELIAEWLRMDGPRRQVVGMISGLDVHYELGDGHPLLGRRMPDLDLVTADGTGRVFDHLHQARGLLLTLGGHADANVEPWADRVRHVGATTDGPWELPVIGAVDPPPAVLVRPDGYVTWVGEPTDSTLPAALEAWCGAAA
jgi:2-polyprenyl-6-methoxyphenol hydroxylase-like FAD-dependent oxidoreductase